MRLFLALLLSLLAIQIYCIDPRACPILDVEHVLSPIDGQENTYRVTFINHDQLLDPEWVDLHLKINDKDQVNIRLASQMSGKQVNQDGVVVQPNDILRYYSTYSVDGTSCDTQTYEFVPSQSNNANVAAIQQQQQQAQQQLLRTRSIRNQMNTIPQQQYIPQQAIYQQPQTQYRNQQFRQNRYAPITSFPNTINDFGIFAAGQACPVIDAENVLTKDQVLENTYTLTFVNNDQALNPEWVDIHLQVEGKEPMNIRLASGLSDKAIPQRGIVVLPGETVRYSATYRVGGMSCDTQISEYTAPFGGQQQQQAFTSARVGGNNRYLPQQSTLRYNPYMPTSRMDIGYDTFAAPRRSIRSLQSRYQSSPLLQSFNEQNQLCPSIQFDQRVEPMPEQNAYKLSFINRNSGLSLDYVDLHYQVNAEPEQNLRIGAGASAVMEKAGLIIAPASHLQYSFTYSVNGVACDTDKYEITTPLMPAQPISQQYPQQYYPQQYTQQWSPLTQSPIYASAPTTPRYVNPVNRWNTINPVVNNRWNPVTGLRYNNNIMPRNSPIYTNRHYPLDSTVRQLPIEGNYYNRQFPQYGGNMRSFSSAALQQNYNQLNQDSEQICPNLEFEQKVEKMINNPNLYVVSFVDKDNIKNVEYVDLHYKIDNGVEENVRLGTSMLASWNPSEKTVSQTGLYMQQGSKLRFYFTYSANGVACDSAHYVAQAF